MRCVARRRADEHEVGGRTLLEQLPYVGRHLLVRVVVICRLEEGALVFQHLQELVLQHFVHLADLVDEEDAAVRLRHHAGLRLGDAAVGKVAPRPLVDGIVHRAQERVRHVARIPAQRRAVRLDEGRRLRKRRMRLLLDGFQDDARRRRLADARRAVEQEVLRVRRGELRRERLDGAFLADDFFERLGAQKLHDGLREVDLFERFELLALLRRLRRFKAALLVLQDLHTDVLHIILVILFELLLDLLLDLVLHAAPRHDVGDALGKLDEDRGDLRFRRHALDRRVLVDDALKGEDALSADGRAHETHGVHLARLDDEPVRAGLFGEDRIERVDLAVDALRPLVQRDMGSGRSVTGEKTLEKVQHDTSFLLIRRRRPRRSCSGSPDAP